MANNIYTRITPVKPKVLNNEQIYVYVPKAGTDKPGIASFKDNDFIVNNVNSEVSLKRTNRNAFERPDLIMLNEEEFEKILVESNNYNKYSLKARDPFNYNTIVKLWNGDFTRTENNPIKIIWPYPYDSNLQRTNDFSLFKLNQDGYLLTNGEGKTDINYNKLHEKLYADLLEGLALDFVNLTEPQTITGLKTFDTIKARNIKAVSGSAENEPLTMSAPAIELVATQSGTPDTVIDKLLLLGHKLLPFSIGQMDLGTTDTPFKDLHLIGKINDLTLPTGTDTLAGITNINPLFKNVVYTAEDGKLTFTKYDNTTLVIDLPLELIIQSGYYDASTKNIILVLANGDTINIPANDLVNEYYADGTTLELYTADDSKLTFKVKDNGIGTSQIKDNSVSEIKLTVILKNKINNKQDKFNFLRINTGETIETTNDYTDIFVYTNDLNSPATIKFASIDNFKNLKSLVIAKGCILDKSENSTLNKINVDFVEHDLPYTTENKIIFVGFTQDGCPLFESDLNEQVIDNTNRIIASEQAISTNAQNISNNSQAISTNAQNISNNSQAISTNTQNISNNSQAISTNSQSIITNNNNAVHKTGDEIIGGVKTFEQAIKVDTLQNRTLASPTRVLNENAIQLQVGDKAVWLNKTDLSLFAETDDISLGKLSNPFKDLHLTGKINNLTLPTGEKTLVTTDASNISPDEVTLWIQKLGIPEAATVLQTLGQSTVAAVSQKVTTDNLLLKQDKYNFLRVNTDETIDVTTDIYTNIFVYTSNSTQPATIKLASLDVLKNLKSFYIGKDCVIDKTTDGTLTKINLDFTEHDLPYTTQNKIYMIGFTQDNCPLFRTDTKEQVDLNTANITTLTSNIVDKTTAQIITGLKTFDTIKARNIKAVSGSAENEPLTVSAPSIELVATQSGTPSTVIDKVLLTGHNLLPFSAGQMDLGTTANKFKDLHLGGKINNLTLPNVTDTIVTITNINPLFKNVVYTANDGKLTFTKYDNTTLVIDLPLELIVQSGHYDASTKNIVLVLANGNTINIPAGALVNEYYADGTTLELYTADDGKLTFKVATALMTTINNKQDKHNFLRVNSGETVDLTTDEYTDIFLYGGTLKISNINALYNLKTFYIGSGSTLETSEALNAINIEKVNQFLPYTPQIDLELAGFTTSNVPIFAKIVVPYQALGQNTDGSVSQKVITDNLELKANERTSLSLIPVGTQIVENEDLNQLKFLKVGKYYCSTNATVQTLQNCPTDIAFMMEVFSPLSPHFDNEETSTWVYRLRVITTLTGQKYYQTCNSGTTVGTFSYNGWVTALMSNNISNLVTTNTTQTITAEKTFGKINATQFNLVV